jgi:hypothetical protein
LVIRPFINVDDCAIETEVNNKQASAVQKYFMYFISATKEHWKNLWHFHNQ